MVHPRTGSIFDGFEFEGTELNELKRSVLETWVSFVKELLEGRLAVPLCEQLSIYRCRLLMVVGFVGTNDVVVRSVAFLVWLSEIDFDLFAFFDRIVYDQERLAHLGFVAGVEEEEPSKHAWFPLNGAAFNIPTHLVPRHDPTSRIFRSA